MSYTVAPYIAIREATCIRISISFLCISLLFISVFPSYLNESHHLPIFQRRLSQSSAVEPLLLIITTKIKVTLISWPYSLFLLFILMFGIDSTIDNDNKQ